MINLFEDLYGMKTIASILFCLLSISFVTSPSNATAAELTAEQELIIHLMLSQTGEHYSHNMRGAIGNKVYVNEDGREAVFDADGEPVQDGINDASYNFFHHEKNPFEHYVFDIEPWIKVGNSANDPTSIDERIYAYMGDLEGGVRRARALWSQTSTAPQELGELPESWAKVLMRPGAEYLFGLINGDLEDTDENVISTMRALYSAFGDVY
jgi:hypothetical protein